MAAKPTNSTSRGNQRSVQPQADNFLEMIRSIREGAGDSIKNDLIAEGGRDVARQLGSFFGFEKPKMAASGELTIGQTINLKKENIEQKEENKNLKMRLAQEHTLAESEKTLVSEQSQKIKLELNAIIIETTRLASSTAQLSKEVKIAAVQAPPNPGQYHINFFESILRFIQGSRKKIEDVSFWIQAQNARSARKRFWGQVKQSGEKRLLSAEDNMVRSAG